MALFGFSDIKFQKIDITNGPLNKLVHSDFERNTYRYPIDLGNYDKAHYVVFYIREQKNTQFSRLKEGEKINLPDATTGLPQTTNFSQNISSITSTTFETALINFGSNIARQILSSTSNNLISNISRLFNGNSPATQGIIDNSIAKIKGGSIFSGTTTKLTRDAIALYMPDTIMYTHKQSYSNLNIGEEIGGQVLAAMRPTIEKYKETGNINLGSILKNAAAGAVTNTAEKIGKVLGKLADSKNTAKLVTAAVLGAVKNPMLEMIYSGPNFRSFQFQFDFYPRSEREALEVQRIIERFRYHQAPEHATAKILGGPGGSEFALGADVNGFLVPPSEFDIKFYYGGTENPNIPPIASNCILQSIDVNYAPDGFRTYEVSGENKPTLGRTGMPFHINVQLQFQETTYLTKSDFNQEMIKNTSLG